MPTLVDGDPRSQVSAQVSRRNVYLRSIAEGFAVFVSERAEAWMPKLRRESELPYPRVIIRDALRAAAASSAGADRTRWTSCLAELEYYVPDRELEPYWAALEHERACIWLMGHANIEHRLDRPAGLSPEQLAAYQHHVAKAAALRPLLDKVTAAALRARDAVVEVADRSAFDLEHVKPRIDDARIPL